MRDNAVVSSTFGEDFRNIRGLGQLSSSRGNLNIRTGVRAESSSKIQ